MELDTQSVVNALIGIVTTVGGWLMKTMTDRIKEVEEDNDELWEKLNDISISLPEKYVSKNELTQLMQKIEHRLDRIDDKLDQIQKQ
jgi:predicted transcriptional regulator